MSRVTDESLVHPIHPSVGVIASHVHQTGLDIPFSPYDCLPCESNLPRRFVRRKDLGNSVEAGGGKELSKRKKDVAAPIKLVPIFTSASSSLELEEKSHERLMRWRLLVTCQAVTECQLRCKQLLSTIPRQSTMVSCVTVCRPAGSKRLGVRSGHAARVPRLRNNLGHLPAS